MAETAMPTRLTAALIDTEAPVEAMTLAVPIATTGAIARAGKQQKRATTPRAINFFIRPQSL
ncbi:MAG: hypothetical protein C0422_04670 [Alcaligenaceae bacterium]|nr:hypothetical protein [Alcaligenaceae bacterium]